LKNKNLKIFTLILTFISVLVGGCVYVTTNAKINSDYSINRYNNIVVICTDDDSDVAGQTENKVLDYLKENNASWVHCYPFSDNYYEGSDSQSASFKEKLKKFIKKNHVDGILFISNGDMNLSSYITGMTSYRNGYTNIDEVDVKSMALKMELYDAQSRDSVWYSRGGASSSSILRGKQDLINFFVSDSMQKLCSTGLLDEK
jgi:hypothetical protein